MKKRLSMHRQLADHAEQIDRLREEIRRTQKLASLGTVACLMAHEFNNLLTPIINYAELALKSPDDQALIHKALEKSVRQGYQAAGVIRSMLGFAREDGDTVEEVAVGQLVDECFRCLARDLSKDQITVVKEVAEGLTIEARAGQLQQVLLNLIINARHAMLEGGGTLTIAGRVEGDEAVIRLADTGCGIAEEVQEQVFEPFFTTKNDGDDGDDGVTQGSGLGLPVCKDLIEGHGGELILESVVGEGTAFTIRLPLRQEAMAPAT